MEFISNIYYCYVLSCLLIFGVVKGIETNCDQTVSKIDDKSGYIFSPDYPKSSFKGDTACTWNLEAPTQEDEYVLYISNINFQLTSNEGDCTGMVDFEDWSFCFWPKQQKKCYIVAPSSDCMELKDLPQNCMRSPNKNPSIFDIKLTAQTLQIPKDPKQFFLLQYEFKNCTKAPITTTATTQIANTTTTTSPQTVSTRPRKPTKRTTVLKYIPVKVKQSDSSTIAIIVPAIAVFLLLTVAGLYCTIKQRQRMLKRKREKEKDNIYQSLEDLGSSYRASSLPQTQEKYTPVVKSRTSTQTYENTDSVAPTNEYSFAQDEVVEQTWSKKRRSALSNFKEGQNDASLKNERTESSFVREKQLEVEEENVYMSLEVPELKDNIAYSMSE